MKSIRKYLQEGEIILWYRYKVKNWYSSRGLLLLGYFIFLILAILGFIVTLNLFQSLYVPSIIISSLIIVTVVFIIFLITDFKKLRKKQLTRTELKNYEQFEILTNKRYIRKNYIWNSKKSLLEYSKEDLEQTKDIVFLNLNCVEGIMVHYGKEIIFFLIGDDIDYFEEWKDWFWTDFYINFRKSELNELKDTLEQLNKIMLLELKEKELDLEIYIVKKK
ncbi:MAG: hypothetical protein ACFE9T_10335 [Promethearchaeota archaeon]